MAGWKAGFVLALSVAATSVTIHGRAQEPVGPEALGVRQNPYQATPPAVSPYLNLLRPNATYGGNYFLETLPQLRQRDQNIRQNVTSRHLRRDLGNLETRAVQGQFALPAIRPTGGAARFQTHLSYFKTR